jgi:8-oxo-dGTP pyrophosphatase MutT (NUDIX family)
VAYADNPFDRERYAKLEAIAAEIYAAHTSYDAATVQAWFELQPGYATPKVDVRAACFRDGRILMVRERRDGRWCLPGGWADVGDSPAEAAVREVREEAGYESVARKLIAVWDSRRRSGTLTAFHSYTLIFQCEITGGEPGENDETDSAEFFARDALPTLSVPRTVIPQLAECFAHWDDPSRPTWFECAGAGAVSAAGGRSGCV